jgi:hypothetical protein
MSMRQPWTAAAFALLALSAASPAPACRAAAPLNLDDVRYADAVVVGRIARYELVLDSAIRRHLGELAADPRARFLPDYARFEVVVDEVLLGNVGRTISVTWDNSTFPEPETMPAGPFLIALRDPRSASPPLRGPSATIVPNREPRSLTVLQAPCSTPFIFERASPEATEIRRILSQSPGRANAR